MMMALKKGVKRNLLILLLFICSYLFVSYVLEGRENGDNKRKIILIEESIRSLANQGKCKVPVLPHDAPEMMKFIKNEPLLDCGTEEDWVVCSISLCAIKKRIIEAKGGFISCEFTDIIRKDDYQFEYGSTTRSTNRYLLQNSDFVEAKCKASDGSKWSGILIGIRKDVEILKRRKELKGVNVLMFGFDSLSRNAFIRTLPKSYEYLTKVLNADVLKGYNIIGDGTPQALIPLLTGFTELELPETRKRKFLSTHVNVYPMIWNQYRDAGYVTAFNEDKPDIGTFSYRLNGFDKQPTDHYMRTYYQAVQNKLKSYKKLCIGEKTRHQIMLDYTKDFLEKYNNTNPSFIFSFHAELSHDSINLISVADDDVEHWLKDMKSSGILNNTILIMMSDHGNRFAEIRNTLQGKLEERLPFFSFVFPEWFKRKYSSQYRNFQSNVDRLTTPFDIHETLQDILNVQLRGNIIRSNHNRAISLFNRIPEHRSCADAFIEPHWCSCLSWQPLNDSTSEEVLRAAKAVVDSINKFTSDYRDVCHELQLGEINWSGKLIPQKNLLRFKTNKDTDGFLADLSADTKVTNDMYQVKITTSPSNAIYESSILYDFIKNEFRTRNISSTSAVQQMIKPPIQVFGIEGRYATALFSAASKQKSLEAVEKDLVKFQSSMKQDPKLRDFIINPTIKRSLKADALNKVAAQVKFNPATGFLLEQLAENGRLMKLDAVINAFRLIMAANRGEIVCEVITAKPLDGAQRKELEAQLKKFIKPNEIIQLTAKVDPSIIGGMVVSIGDKYIDMSVASKVKKYTDLISVPV
ncbi:CLUMA_CG015153, isoform A [Clunio marinus]|uniref:Oligomycin sensitivity conferral protein n=1 Tax=Clunio marinus TaxID=568069 RepID=A0A1J1INU8_9DIPT|nr:CLUMA_CG015153, isoform A [Clunio marinus]